MSELDLAQYKALIIEDNDFVRYMVKKHMVSFGFDNVFEAVDGFEGINKLATHEPDIIVCDINMAPVDGFDFLKHVRRLDSALRNLPVIFLTSSADEVFVKRALALDVDAYLLKPVMPKQLRHKIETLLKVRMTA